MITSTASSKKTKRGLSGFVGLIAVLLAFAAGCASPDTTTAAADTSSGAASSTSSSPAAITIAAAPTSASPSPSPTSASPSAIPTTHAAAPVHTTAAPVVHTSAAPVHTTQKPAPTTAAAGCHPRSSSGNCYKAGEFCSNADHNMTGTDANGRAIKCEPPKSGTTWHWEYV